MSEDHSIEAAPAAVSLRARVLKRWRLVAGAALLLVGLVLAFAFRDHILLAALDPKQPFQTYKPPAAPDYATPAAWALLPPATPPAGQPRPLADVFFIHPTTYNGGEEWSGPIDHPRAARLVDQVMLPNYAGPFARVGRVFAPRYRQASLYAMRTAREDSREARRFAYDDVRRAFRDYLARANAGRPFILAGVEQGGSIAERLVREEVAADPALLKRFVAAYLIESPTPADLYVQGRPIPACAARAQAGCVVAFASAPMGDARLARHIHERAMAWDLLGQLQPLGARALLCVNPMLGAVTTALAPEQANLGAVNATDLEWGSRPAFLPRQVSAQCRQGVLEVSRPRSPMLKPAIGWADRLKAPEFNLFYADLEADALARLRTAGAAPDPRPLAPPITTSIAVRAGAGDGSIAAGRNTCHDEPLGRHATASIQKSRPTMTTGSDIRRASRLVSSASTAARKTGELAMASGEVIARRTAIGARAMGQPSASANIEAVRMVSEKSFAMVRSGLAAAKAAGDLSNRSATIAVNETAILGRAVAAASRARTPLDLATVQTAYAVDAFSRMMSQGLALASLAATANAAAMAPFHTAATANARRLRR